MQAFTVDAHSSGIFGLGQIVRHLPAQKELVAPEQAFDLSGLHKLGPACGEQDGFRRSHAAGTVCSMAIFLPAGYLRRKGRRRAAAARWKTLRRDGPVNAAMAMSQMNLQAEVADLRAKVAALQEELRQKDGELKRWTVQRGTSDVLNIFHFNDVYTLKEQALPTFCSDDRVGGVMRFKTLVDGVARERSMRPMLIFSGDFVAPSLASIATYGRHMVEAFNLLGVDFGCFGNHDLDYGLTPGPGGRGLEAILQERMDGRDERGRPVRYFPASKTKWLCSNMLEADGKPIAGAARTAVVDWDCDPNGSGGSSVRVGLFSVVYDYRGSENTHNINYVPAIEAARDCVEELRSQGAQVIIAVTHLPLNGDDDTEPSDEMLMKNVEGIDLLLGGHDHFYLYDAERKIVKSGSEFRHLSWIQIRMEHGHVSSIHCERFDVTRGIPADAVMAALVEKYERLLTAEFGRVVGRTDVALDSREKVLRFGESRLMNFITDAVATSLLPVAGNAAHGVPNVDVCIMEACSVTGEQVLSPGDIACKDLRLWFASTGKLVRMVVLDLTGLQIRQQLEQGVAALPGESWALLHVSADLTYEAELWRPVGARILNIRFRGRPLQDDEVLHCAVTTDFASWNAATAPRHMDEDAAVSLLEVVLGRLEQLGRPIDEDLAPLGRLKLRRCTGGMMCCSMQGLETSEAPMIISALGEPRSGLPDVSSSEDASRIMYRNADALLGIESSSWQAPVVTIGSNNFSKLLRMVECLGVHQVPIRKASRALPFYERCRLSDTCESRDELSRFEIDCIGKMFCYEPGVMVGVSGLCVDRDEADRTDQWFFADTTPGGTAVYVKDRTILRESIDARERFHFRPSLNVADFVGKSASFSVLIGQMQGPPNKDGEVLCHFFDGGTIHGTIVAPRGVDVQAPCLPMEYIFQCHGSGGRTLAEVRGDRWQALTAKQAPRFVDNGPYAAAARRFVTGVPSWSRWVTVEPPTDSHEMDEFP
eukprot:TRINITY_DN121865_c0_g1_i1.p1 TRINITY_DN121865_c0_g1~~TRINITY_DN121865_c0_g1_i1.p1  ORF type:complete len:990 (+),score=122.83 TRINITY_DN121865_c0_g1_i1:127-3096(+)